MKSKYAALSILLAFSVIRLTGCSAKETPSNTAAPAAPVAGSNANGRRISNQAVQPPLTNRNADQAKANDPSVSPKPNAPAQLLGTYESREIEDKGVVTLIGDVRTTWLFSPGGTYSRVSQVKGKTYHSDSGLFRIEPPDRVVLTIQMSGQKKASQKIQSPPVEKTYKFSLSPDGEELRLTSGKGAVATFRRTAKPNTP